jgi:hypothetical protein
VRKPFNPPTEEQVAKYMAELEKADWCDVLPDEEYDDYDATIVFFREKSDTAFATARCGCPVRKEHSATGRPPLSASASKALRLPFSIPPSLDTSGAFALPSTGGEAGRRLENSTERGHLWPS